MASWRKITAKKVSNCVICGASIPIGAEIYWKYPEREVRCERDAPTSIATGSEADQLSRNITPQPENPGTLAGPEELTAEHLVDGIPGNAARSIYNKKAEEMRQYRERLLGPKLGRFVNRYLSPGDEAEKWKKGAIGEEGVAQVLERLCLTYGWHVLHDRAIPKSSANIDHILVTNRGCFVIDSKHMSGKIDIEYPGTLLTPKPPVLKIAGRSRMSLVNDAKKYTQRVEAALNSAKIALPVFGMLAFFNAEFPIFLKPVEIEGILINGKGIETAILTKPLLAIADLKSIHDVIAQRFLAKKVS